MLNILICDDEQRCRNQLREMLIKLSFSIDVEIWTHSFSSGEDLLKAYENRKRDYELLFLDIEMTGLNGIETAKKFRETYNYEGQLVFMTNHVEHMQDSFAVGTNQYLLKPVTYEEFDIKIRPIINNLLKDNQRLTIELVSGGFKLIPLSSIIVISSNSMGRKGGVIIQTESEEIQAYGKMMDYLEKLEKRQFFRIHKQTIINLEQVVFFDGEIVRMTNRQSLKVSRNVKKSLKDRLMNSMSI